MQRSELEAEIGRLLGDPQHTRWSLDVIDSRLELAQQDVQALTGAVKSTETLTPTANTSEVTVDTEVIDILRVTLTESDGTVSVLEGRSREDWDFYDPNWPNLSPGKPKGYFFDASNGQIVLVPAPSATYAIADALKVWEVQIPVAMTGDSSVPFGANSWMKAYHMALVHYVVSLCFMDNGDPDSLQKARFHRSNEINAPGEYEKELKKINAKFDSPADIPERVKWQPQGARRSQVVGLSKAAPLG